MSAFWAFHASLGILLIGMAVAVPRLEAGPGDQGDSSYRELVARVSKGDLSIDFRALRFACLKADDCDPRGDSNDLILMRRAMQSKDYDKAAKMAEALIDHGFVNIEAHAICSQAYEALNNPDKARFHHAVAASLIHSILKTGDGKTKETAFEVIGTFEEYIVVSVLGLPGLSSQSLLPSKKHSFDRLEVNDPRTGQKVSVYFNIDAFYPIKGL